MTILTDSYVTVDGNISANGQQPCYLTGELGSPPADPTSCAMQRLCGRPIAVAALEAVELLLSSSGRAAGPCPSTARVMSPPTVHLRTAFAIRMQGAPLAGGGRIEVPMSAEDVVNRLKVAAVVAAATTRMMPAEARHALMVVRDGAPGEGGTRCQPRVAANHNRTDQRGGVARVFADNHRG